VHGAGSDRGLVILLYCFHSNVLLEEHGSTAYRIVNYKLYFAVITLFATVLHPRKLSPSSQCFYCVSPVPQAQTNAVARGSERHVVVPYDANSFGCHRVKIRVERSSASVYVFRRSLQSNKCYLEVMADSL
jgi:hypothetical protein